jgi:hypothetical protein
MKWVQAAAHRIRGHRFLTKLVRWTIALAPLMLCGSALVDAQLVPCTTQADRRSIADALLEIRRRVDPCGDSPEVIALLENLRRCTRATYQICSDVRIDRNLFERPLDAHGHALSRTITWNPELRSELEWGCDGDPRKPVLRDPTASLLHELAHAAQDCEGLNPGEHELEAVRTENIYRRAAGLCQRRKYGDDPLPREMVKICASDRCVCSSPPSDPGDPEVRNQQAAPGGQADRTAAAGDAQLRRQRASPDQQPK